MKRFYIFVLIILIFSCKRDNDQGKTILFQHYFTGSLSSGIDSLTESINSSQKQFTFIATPMEHEEFKVSIRTQLDGKNPPDLFSYWAGAKTRYLVESNKVSPITDLIDNVTGRDIFDKSVLDACSYNGEIYLLPITRHFVGFFYSKKIFRELDIEIPETWDDLISAGDKLKENGITPFFLGGMNRWPSQFWFDYILLRNSGFDYREKLVSGDSSYLDTEVIDAVILWKDLIDRDFFNSDIRDKDWSDGVNQISEGKCGMTLMGTWILPVFKSSGMEPDSDYGFFSFPVINSSYPSVPLGPIDGVLLSKASINRELAMDVLNQFTTEKTQEAFNASSGAIAPQIKTSDSIYNSIQLEIKRIIGESENWSFNYDLATIPSVSEAGLNFFNEFIENPERYMDLLAALEEVRVKNIEK